MKPLRARAVVTACCSLLAACGKSQPASMPARFEIAGIPAQPVPGQQIARLRTFVADHPGPTAVVACGDTLAGELLAAHLGVRIVAIADSVPQKTDKALPFDAIVLPDTGVAAAIDLALLACNGIALPSRVLPIGVRWFTKANLAAGGDAMPASGDPILALLRMQHADVLTTRPATDEIHRIGFAQFRDSAWHTRARSEAEAAAKTHAQIELKTANANGDVAAQDRQLNALLQDGCRAILVSTDDPSTVTAFAEQARRRGVAVIVLDPRLGEHGDGSVGSDSNAIGRATGQAILQLLPAGGRVVELLPDLPSPLLEQRHQGLATALGAR